LRELFTLGLGSKRGDESKIGHKGSGCKFMLAMLHRLGSHLEVQVGQHNLKSVSVVETIRGNEHRLIRLEGTSGGLPSMIDTHISENAGADTWTEPWFALRELIQNAIDEGGQFYVVPEVPQLPETGTRIIVPLTPELQAAWDNRQTWLHVRHQEIIYDAPGSCGLYYHGFRVYEGSGWRWAYDVTDMLTRDKLSEDRQLRNVDLQQLFKQILMKTPEMPSDFYTEFLRSDQKTPADVRSLIYACYYHGDRSHPEFGGFKMSKLEEAVNDWSCGKKVAFTTESNTESPTHYHATAQGYTVLVVGDHYASLVMGYSNALVNADGVLPAVTARMKPVREIESEVGDRLKSALRITKKLRPPGCKVRVAKMALENDKVEAQAFADIQNNEVLLMESFVNGASTEELAEALVEEYVHLASHCSDGSISFEKALIKSIVRLVYPRRAIVEAL
jgi:hypothetical protein